jgi:hypothetical protein
MAEPVGAVGSALYRHRSHRGARDLHVVRLAAVPLYQRCHNGQRAVDLEAALAADGDFRLISFPGHRAQRLAPGPII